MEINIDDVTYEIRIDDSASVKISKTNQKYYIRAGFPRKYITDNMTYREVQKVTKSMRQLGYTVIDRTKG